MLTRKKNVCEQHTKENNKLSFIYETRKNFFISDTVQIVVQRRNEKNIGKNLGNRNAQFFYSPTMAEERITFFLLFPQFWIRIFFGVFLYKKIQNI